MRQTPKSAVNFGGQSSRRLSYVTLPADLWPPTRHWRPGYSRQNTITLAAALQTPTRAGPTPNISQACWRQSSASLTAARQPPTGLFGGHSTAGYLTQLWHVKFESYFRQYSHKTTARLVPMHCVARVPRAGASGAGATGTAATSAAVTGAADAVSPCRARSPKRHP